MVVGRMIGNKRSFGSITTYGNPTHVTSTSDRFFGDVAGKRVRPVHDY